MAIVSQNWDFGNGVTSSDLAPLTTFGPGVYDVTLTVVDDVEGTSVTTHELYIRVTEDNQSLVGTDYFNNPKCLHYGWFSGWSEYAGDRWVWPGTPASVTEYLKDDKMFTLVWDIKDGKRYAINVEETNNTEAVFKDKEQFDIETVLKLPEYVGEQQHYDVSHLETFVVFRPELLSDELPDSFSIDVALITNVDNLPVEVQKKADFLREVTFFYQNKQTKSTQSRQLQITTNSSEYQLINYESYFKINDRFRTPSFNVVSTPQEYYAGALHWFSKGKGYQYDRSTGLSSDLLYTPIEGPDDSISAAEILAPSQLLLTATEIDGGCVSLWYKDEFGANVPTIEDPLEGSIPFIDYETKNGWILAYFNGTIPEGAFIDNGFKVFDVRVIDAVTNTDNLDDYFTKLDLYLPR